MAKFYGKTGSFLSGRELKYFFGSVVMVLLPVVVVLALYLSGQAVASLVAILLSLFFIVQGGFGIFRILHRRSLQFYKGRRGERQVKEILKELPNDFFVFENVFLDPKKGNLDFVVAWPGGVAILEVKSMGGNFNSDGSQILINHRPLRGKNILRQAQGQMWALKKYLERRARQKVFVHPSLVFTHDHASITDSARKIAGIELVQKNHLLDWIYSLPAHRINNFGEVVRALQETI